MYLRAYVTNIRACHFLPTLRALFNRDVLPDALATPEGNPSRIEVVDHDDDQYFYRSKVPCYIFAGVSSLTPNEAKKNDPT